MDANHATYSREDKDFGRRQRFHGDEQRFEVLADLVFETHGRNIRYICDVAGGQGMLSRILSRKYNYDCEVVDPRGHTLKGVANRAAYFSSHGADYYDLLIGLHLYEAMREVALASLRVPTIFIPCCNFWSDSKLGTKELNGAIEAYLKRNGVYYELIELPLKKPKNIAFVTTPTKRSRESDGAFDEPVLEKLRHQMT